MYNNHLGIPYTFNGANSRGVGRIFIPRSCKGNIRPEDSATIAQAIDGVLSKHGRPPFNIVVKPYEEDRFVVAPDILEQVLYDCGAEPEKIPGLIAASNAVGQQLTPSLGEFHEPPS